MKSVRFALPPAASQIKIALPPAAPALTPLPPEPNTVIPAPARLTRVEAGMAPWLPTPVVRFNAHIPKDAPGWNALGLHGKITGVTLGKATHLQGKERSLGYWLSQVNAHVTLPNANAALPSTHVSTNGLAAWGLEAASLSAEDFADFLLQHGHNPALMHGLVRTAPSMFTDAFLQTVLPERAMHLVRFDGPPLDRQGLWRTGCRIAEGYIKHLMLAPPATDAHAKLKYKGAKPQDLPAQYVGVVNAFQSAEEYFLDLFDPARVKVQQDRAYAFAELSPEEMHERRRSDAAYRRECRAARQLVAEWFAGAALRRFSSPAFRRSGHAAQTLDLLCNVARDLRNAPFSKNWDNAYVRRESSAWRDMKHQAGTSLSRLGHGVGTALGWLGSPWVGMGALDLDFSGGAYGYGGPTAP